MLDINQGFRIPIGGILSFTALQHPAEGHFFKNIFLNFIIK